MIGSRTINLIWRNLVFIIIIHWALLFIFIQWIPSHLSIRHFAKVFNTALLLAIIERSVDGTAGTIRLWYLQSTATFLFS